MSLNSKQLFEKEDKLQGRTIIESELHSEEPYIKLDDGRVLYLDESEREEE